jgi:hypothetical protein
MPLGHLQYFSFLTGCVTLDTVGHPKQPAWSPGQDAHHCMAESVESEKYGTSIVILMVISMEIRMQAGLKLDFTSYFIVIFSLQMPPANNKIIIP